MYSSFTVIVEKKTLRKFFIHIHTRMHVHTHRYTQGIYNCPGIKCKNGRLEIAARIIDHFYLVDLLFARFFLLDERCIYSAHVGT